MSRFAVLGYGVLCYLVFLGIFLYTIGFVGDLLVQKSIDSGDPEDGFSAVALDVLLLALFAMPHSVMARRGFKERWTRLVPPPIERSTFVLVSSLLLALLCWQWRPLPGVVWEVRQSVGRALLLGAFGVGWGVALWSTFLIDHFDLLGLRQVWLYARGRAYTPVPFKTAVLYRYVRHPLVLGFLIAFWATPRMTIGHVLFAAGMTLYSLIAIQLEERDLLRFHGADYAAYRRQVSMLLPLPWKADVKPSPPPAPPAI